MTRNKWSDLAKLADMIFDAEAQKLAKLHANEAKLQQQKERLEEMNANALKSFEGVHPSHQLNGDVQWQMWVGQTAQNLSHQQARARALSEIHKPGLQKAFGRKSVLASLPNK